MKTDKRSLIGVLAIVAVAVFSGALCLWLISGDEAQRQEALRESALCVLTLEADSSEVSNTVTTDAVIETFQVGMVTKGEYQRVSLVISGGEGVVASATVRAGIGRFGLGHHVPPGVYHMTLGRVAGDQEVVAVISASEPEIVTGWQTLSRFILTALVVSGMCALAARWFGATRSRIMSAYLFQILLFVLVMLFTYLLFHEGGHALAQMAFGRFDLSRSDFWGLYGTPHSGGIMGPTLDPWKRALVSASGPMLPTLIGWLLYVLYLTPQGRSIRSGRPTIALYWTALVPMLILSAVVTIPLFVFGMVTSDGDWNGFINNVPGPSWLVYALVWIVFIVSALVAVGILPELSRAWMAWIRTFQLQQPFGGQEASYEPDMLEPGGEEKGEE